MPLAKHTLSLAAEYAVASELCRKGIYTQLTLGNMKRTDLLALTENGNVARVEVKAKQGSTWPGCKGISGKDSVIVFVDYQNKEPHESPDFYVLTSKNWKSLVRSRKRAYEKTHPGKTMSIKDGIPVHEDETTKTGKPYTGMSVSVQRVSKYKDMWEKIDEITSNA